MTDPILSARGRLAYASRRDGDPRELEAARHDLAAAKLERHIREALPAITPAQRDELASLLRGGRA